eukprot:TRINITY_DN19098_c0_g1_i1.p1 TRINITY_DN19098_c0_g1~~TRINITY_DN19098_c0_g1_i1.p1  ORF type:complete len:659 (+),score=120.10 TRINITY_DN19098_c0_g1_i1:52-2028(+)
MSPSLPAGSAVRAASAARRASPSPRGRRPSSEAATPRLQQLPRRERRESSIVDGRRPCTAELMAGPARLQMSPWHPRRLARGDVCLQECSKEERELHQVCEQIGLLAPQKFSSIREAFRFLRPDHNGQVARSDVRYFFRAYGVDRVQADRLFCLFDKDGTGFADCQTFVAHLRQYIQPDGDWSETAAATSSSSSLPGAGSAVSSKPATPRSGSGSMQCSQQLNLSAQHAEFANELGGALVQREFGQVLQLVREKAPGRFANAREALRFVDIDYDGRITRDEVRLFFRAFGIMEDISDRIFDRLAGCFEKDVKATCDYHSFVKVISPYLDLPGIVAASRRPSSSRPSSRGRSASPRPMSSSSAAQFEHGRGSEDGRGGADQNVLGEKPSSESQPKAPLGSRRSSQTPPVARRRGDLPGHTGWAQNLREANEWQSAQEASSRPASRARSASGNSPRPQQLEPLKLPQPSSPYRNGRPVPPPLSTPGASPRGDARRMCPGSPSPALVVDGLSARVQELTPRGNNHEPAHEMTPMPERRPCKESDPVPPPAPPRVAAAQARRPVGTPIPAAQEESGNATRRRPGGAAVARMKGAPERGAAAAAVAMSPQVPPRDWMKTPDGSLMPMTPRKDSALLAGGRPVARPGSAREQRSPGSARQLSVG